MIKSKIYILENDFLYAEFCNYGARLTKLIVKEKGIDVVVGYDGIEGYHEQNNAMGATLGRVAHTIKDGKANVHHHKLPLSTDESGNHVNGGVEGFDRLHWQAKTTKTKVVFTVEHASNEYPGVVTVKVTYELFYENLNVVYEAMSTVDTLCNMSNRIYFNLGKEDTVLHHRLLMYADEAYMNTHDGHVSKDKVSVKNTIFDFLHFKRIGKMMDETHPQLLPTKGYEHYFVLRKNEVINAQLLCDDTKLCMSLISDSPALRMSLGTTIQEHAGKNNRMNQAYCGVCMAPTKLPYGVTHEGMNSIFLQKDVAFKQKLTYHFTLLDE